MVFSLGETYGGVWPTEEEDWFNFKTTADKSGEYVWSLPFHNDFRRMLDPDFAEIKNTVSNPRAGTSRAACFLVEFTTGTPSIHLDVAATAESGDKGQAVMLKTLYNSARTMLWK